ncbi:hypothetical protein [Acidianus brierleyi]|uniref:hypothetical protein n=1 Tax=Acidianus brierleyi TaxID=41673 RepID=UPI0013A55EE8|nr:hypothetical protein [Acidianus brierleyi]
MTQEITDIIKDIDSNDNIDFPYDLTVENGVIKSYSDEVYDVFRFMTRVMKKIKKI